MARFDTYISSLENAACGLDDEATLPDLFLENSVPAKVFSGLYTAFTAAKHRKLLVGINIVESENGYVAIRG